MSLSDSLDQKVVRLTLHLLTPRITDEGRLVEDVEPTAYRAVLRRLPLPTVLLNVAHELEPAVMQHVAIAARDARHGWEVLGVVQQGGEVRVVVPTAGRT